MMNNKRTAVGRIGAVVGVLVLVGAAWWLLQSRSADRALMERGLGEARVPTEPRDGTYRAEAPYRTPQGVEPFVLTLEIAGGVVREASLEMLPQVEESRRYQDAFAAEYRAYVIGKPLADLSLERVSGSSLTTGAFNTALSAIRVQAGA